MRHLRSIPVMLAVAITAMGCSDRTPVSVSPRSGIDASALPAGVSTVDIGFVRSTVSLQLEAVIMARMADSAGVSPRVQALATTIMTSAGLQLTSARACLSAWRLRGPSAPMMSSGAMIGAPSMMAGMAEMAALRGAAFDTDFLTRMSAQHRAASAAAHHEVAYGTDDTARAMARGMTQVLGQETEMIREMEARTP